MPFAVPTAPPATVSSPLQQLRRKLYTGRSDTYDLLKVIDIDKSLYKTSKLI
jgi:hypothetical protein